MKEIKPVAIIEAKPGVWRVDLGVNFAGWIEVKAAGAPGDRIEFKWSERQDQEMTHRGYLIQLTQGNRHVMLDTLIHEWAHARAWRSRRPHGDKWGKEYANAYRLVIGDDTL